MKSCSEFGEFYDEEGKVLRLDETHPDVPVRFRRIIHPLLPKKSGEILDAGCGDGYLVSQLRKLGFGAVGIDLSKNRVDHAKKAYGDFYSVASIYETGFSDAKFDVVIASEVIEHLEDPDKAIEELKRVSRDYIILTMPYKERLIQDVCPHCLKTFFVSGHIQYFDKDRIENMMRAHNLKIIKMKKVAYYPFINFPLPVAKVVNWILAVLDKTTYIGILAKKQ